MPHICEYRPMSFLWNQIFNRRRQDKRRSLEPCSHSADSSPLHRSYRSCSRPKSIQNDLLIAPRTSAYETPGRKLNKEWECGLCGKQLSEPRLLSCLHQFCTKCLLGLQEEGELGRWNEDGQILVGDSNSGVGSAGSGYESDPRNHSESDASWNSEHKERPFRYGILTRKISGKTVQLLQCPSCAYETQIPLGGISALPLNTILLRKIAASALEDEKNNILCDICTTDTKAESRCNHCLVSVCSSCSEVHSRQKATKRHSLHPLNQAKVRFCNQHPRAELCIYCATCQQVICRDCCFLSHSGHALADSSRAAAERSRLLKDACDRAKFVPRQVEKVAMTLREHAHENDIQASKVEADVTEWAEQYRRAVEAHGRSLCAAAGKARARYHQRVCTRNKELQDRVEQVEMALKFADDLLKEGREDEVLSLSNSVLRRLERVSELNNLAEPPSCSLRFASTAPIPGDIPLVGRLLTHTPDHEKCVVYTDGLQDLRVDEEYEVIMELRDGSGDRIWCGGEAVAAYIRRRDSSARPDVAKVVDRGDGSYSILVKPMKPGAYLLAVTLNNKPLKGSPYLCAARVSKGHTGQYHCCTFCSSGGSRDAQCGCGAIMSGGYKGCGHGHAGHPGSRHWSCCGSTKKSGACSRRPYSHQIYQFSL